MSISVSMDTLSVGDRTAPASELPELELQQNMTSMRFAYSVLKTFC